MKLKVGADVVTGVWGVAAGAPKLKLGAAVEVAPKAGVDVVVEPPPKAKEVVVDEPVDGAWPKAR